MNTRTDYDADTIPVAPIIAVAVSVIFWAGAIVWATAWVIGQ